MVVLLTLIHVIICIFLIIVVLLQSGKAADLAGAFGGMGSQTAFGPRGSATLLSKATTIAAALFMVTSLTLAILASRGGGSNVGSTVLERTSGKATQTAPAPKPVLPAKPAPGGGVTVPLNIPRPGAPAQGAPQQPAPAQPQQKPATPAQK